MDDDGKEDVGIDNNKREPEDMDKDENLKLNWANISLTEPTSILWLKPVNTLLLERACLTDGSNECLLRQLIGYFQTHGQRLCP